MFVRVTNFKFAYFYLYQNFGFTPTMAQELVVNKEEHIIKPDSVDDYLFHAVDYVYKKKALFISLAVGIIVLILSGVLGYQWLEKKAVERSSDLYEIELVIKDKNLSFANKNTQVTKLVQNFQTNHKGSLEQSVASFYQAQLLYSAKKYKESEKIFKNVITSLEGDSAIKSLATLYLSHVYRDQQKLDDAIRTLSSLNTDWMPSVRLIELIELYVVKGDKKAAKQNLEVFLKEFPNSSYSSRASQILSSL
ncbi:MAG: putative negative regulator of RcsB-dependent stress response [bacterium]|jgi:predicted negative regulator of RcsB-dependent stress response